MKTKISKLFVFFSAFSLLFIGSTKSVFGESLPAGCSYVQYSSGNCQTGKTERCLNPYVCCEKQEQCKAVPTPLPANWPFEICQGNNKCQECMYVSNSSTMSGKTWTALGCIPTDSFNNFVSWFLGKAIFIASGIAFLLMAFGAIQILTSAGSPEKMKAGSELITSALSGLLLIILSVFLLKLIGVDILQLPGFGR